MIFLTIHHIEVGRIQGVDFSGVSMVNLVHVGMFFLDDMASADQRASLLSILAPVTEDDVEVRTARTDYLVRGDRGLVTVSDVLVVRIQPPTLEGVTPELNLPEIRPGRTTVLPALAAVSMRHLPVSRGNWELTGRNAIHVTFCLDEKPPVLQRHPRHAHHR